MRHFGRDYRVVFRKEFRELLRDRRSLFWLFAPPILLPGIAICAVLFIGTQLVRIADDGVGVMIENPEAAPELVERFEDSETTFIVENEEEALIIVEIPDDFQAQLEAGESASIQLITTNNSLITIIATGAARVIINEYGDDIRDQRLEERGITDEFLNPITIGEERRVTTESVAGGSDDGGGPNILATIFLPLAVTSYLVGGGIGLILDTTVGEKERQTIENILVTPANRVSVVMGKMSVVFLASLLVMGLWLAEGLLLSSLSSAGGDLLEENNPTPTTFLDAILEGGSDAIGLIAALLLLIVPFTVLLNGLVMAWCAYAANYREANLFMVLVQLGLPATVLLTIFSFPADVSDLVYGLPMLGTIVAIRDLFSSSLSVAGLVINLVTASAYAFGAVLLAAWVFGREWSLTRGLQ